MNHPLPRWHPLTNGKRLPIASSKSRLLLRERKVATEERVAVRVGWVIGFRSGELDRGGMRGVDQNGQLRDVNIEGPGTYSEFQDSSRIPLSLGRRLPRDRQEWQDLPLSVLELIR